MRSLLMVIPLPEIVTLRSLHIGTIRSQDWFSALSAAVGSTESSENRSFRFRIALLDIVGGLSNLLQPEPK